MASVSKEVLLNGNVTASSTGSKVSLNSGSKNFVGVIVVSNRVGGTFTGKIQHSSDGTNWFDLATFAAHSTNTSELINITANVLGYIRYDLTATSTPNADVKIELCFDEGR